MELSVRVCMEADEAAVEALPAPEAAARRKLFGLTHAGALIETSHLALCVEKQPQHGSSGGGTADAPAAPPAPLLAGFAALDDQVPPSLARWPEVREYLKKRLQFGKPHGCVLLSAFRHDPQVCSEREVLATLLHQLFVLRPELGGVVLAAPVGVDLDELGLFKQAFSCYDAVALSSGGLYCFYRAVRTDYTPSVFVRRPHASEAEQEHLEAMVKHFEAQRRPHGAPWFDAATAPRQALNNQDEHRLCLVSQSVGTSQPSGLLACTDSVADDSVDAYARLFSELYRRSNPVPAAQERVAAPVRAPEPVESPREAEEEQEENPVPPPNGTTSAVAPVPAPAPTFAPPAPIRNLERPSGGPPNVVVLGPTGAGKATQSQRLVTEFGVVYVCAGDLLRLAVQDGHEEAKRCMDAGDLVPDDVVQELVLDRLAQSDCRARGWLLEGFPRTETQARVLIGHGARPDVVVSLELSDEDVTQRSMTEADVGPPEPAPVSRRVALYREHREAVRQVFVKTSTVVHVDAARSRDSITRKLVREVYRARGSRCPLRLRRPPRLVITGAPASGKGTQCELLVKALGVVHLSTGDMLRQASRDGSALGKQAQSFMDDGQLVPDDLIVDVVLERLAQADCQTRGWLLDGFPRTATQAQALLAARDASTTPDCVLALDVPDDEVVKRIAGRRMDPETGKTFHVDFNPPPPDVAQRCVQRSDDTEETVRTRLEAFHAHSDAVVAALGGACDVIRADGTQAVAKVADALLGGAERCLLRNNAVVLSLFSMAPDAVTRASLFLRSVFEHFQEKDCLLLCLSARAARPAITSGFRIVRGDPTLSTVSKLQRDGDEAVVARPKKGGKDEDGSVLYAFHRHELPFLASFELDLSDDNEPGAAASRPVIVKGLGVKGFGRTVRAWGGKCAELLGFGRKKGDKKPKQPKSPKKAKQSKAEAPAAETRPRVVSDSADPAATSTAAALDDASAEEAAAEVTRNTLH